MLSAPVYKIPTNLLGPQYKEMKRLVLAKLDSMLPAHAPRPQPAASHHLEPQQPARQPEVVPPPAEKQQLKTTWFTQLGGYVHAGRKRMSGAVESGEEMRGSSSKQVRLRAGGDTQPQPSTVASIRREERVAVAARQVPLASQLPTAGQICNATIGEVKPYGAFVDLVGDYPHKITGLIRKSIHQWMNYSNEFSINNYIPPTLLPSLIEQPSYLNK